MKNYGGWVDIGKLMKRNEKSNVLGEVAKISFVLFREVSSTRIVTELLMWKCWSKTELEELTK